MHHHRWIARLLTAAPTSILLLAMGTQPATAGTSGEPSGTVPSTHEVALARPAGEVLAGAVVATFTRWPFSISSGEPMRIEGAFGVECEPGTLELGLTLRDFDTFYRSDGVDPRDGTELVLGPPPAGPGEEFDFEVATPDLGGATEVYGYSICRWQDGYAEGTMADEFWAVGLGLIEDVRPAAEPDEPSAPSPAAGEAAPDEATAGDRSGGNELFGEGRSNVVAAVPPADETPWNLRSLLASSLLAALVVLLVVFPSELFNSTLDEHYEEIKAAVRRWVPWSRPRHPSTELAGAEGAAAAGPADATPGGSRRGWVGFVAMTGAIALLYGLLDPGFGLNLASGVLVIGVAAGVAVSTSLSAATTGWLVQRRFGQADYWFRLLPGTLVVAAVCVAVSRLVGFLPGYLYGLVGGLAFRQSLDDDDQARTVLLASGAVLAASVVGWIAYGPVADRVTAGASLPWVVGESILAGTFVAGVQGLLFSLLPLRYLPGEKLFRWSRPVWVAVYGLAAFAFVHLIARPAAAGGPAGVSWAKTLALFLVFGGTSVAFWAYWRRRDAEGEDDSTPEPEPLIVTGA